MHADPSQDWGSGDPEANSEAYPGLPQYAIDPAHSSQGLGSPDGVGLDSVTSNNITRTSNSQKY